MDDPLHTSSPMRLAPDHANGIKRVQVGAGPKHLRPDWWNTDIRNFPGLDQVMDATAPWQWKGVLDAVYAEHFLEHLSIEDGMSFLVQAGQALAPGGKIRLSTPGLEWVVLTHFNVNETDPDRRIAQTFTMNRAFHGWGHRFLYSNATLQWLFEHLGYSDVKFFDYGVSDDPLLSNLELHGGWSVVQGMPSVWIIEATRGEADIIPSEELLLRVEADFVRYVRSGH